ncbi:hypothetical protein EVAR_102997_1 [Eumeta japonica]|uniref:Uncharacterized protein n=1 Tax=Eumeta variegata TaxID=151549 RepID=A0A4C1URF9_EUMVA|nr:hypothetical protein EVAR_102997_1 [Eumeta japonica]
MAYGHASPLFGYKRAFSRVVHAITEIHYSRASAIRARRRKRFADGRLALAGPRYVTADAITFLSSKARNRYPSGRSTRTAVKTCRHSVGAAEQRMTHVRWHPAVACLCTDRHVPEERPADR